MRLDGLTLGIDIGGTSVKAALLEGDRTMWTGKSGAYARPDAAQLVRAIKGLIPETGIRGVGRLTAAGVCAPGLRDAQGVITRAVNVPGLVGTSPARLVSQAADELAGVRVVECSDSHAAAVDYWHAHAAEGRMLALSMGTGIGACVLDSGSGWAGGGEPTPLVVTGRGPGQIGQMDVGEGSPGDQPVGPDGGRGTLEAYLGLPALRARFGEDPAALHAAINGGGLRVDQPPLRALVRALRIAHAVYLPDRIVLLGGVGIRLTPTLGEIRAAVADGLTTLARADWALECGDSDFHAACGAARLARAAAGV